MGCSVRERLRKSTDCPYMTGSWVGITQWVVILLPPHMCREIGAVNLRLQVAQHEHMSGRRKEKRLPLPDAKTLRFLQNVCSFKCDSFCMVLSEMLE